MRNSAAGPSDDPTPRVPLSSSESPGGTSATRPLHGDPSCWTPVAKTARACPPPAVSATPRAWTAFPTRQLAPTVQEWYMADIPADNRAVKAAAVDAVQSAGVATQGDIVRLAQWLTLKGNTLLLRGRSGMEWVADERTFTLPNSFPVKPTGPPSLRGVKSIGHLTEALGPIIHAGVARGSGRERSRRRLGEDAKADTALAVQDGRHGEHPTPSARPTRSARSRSPTPSTSPAPTSRSSPTRWRMSPSPCSNSPACSRTTSVRRCRHHRPHPHPRYHLRHLVDPGHPRPTGRNPHGHPSRR